MNNPYIAGAPLRAGKAFFGRQDILQWAMQELRNPASNALVLFGQRRIGKTSLLLQLQGGLPREAFLPVYFDLQDQAKRPLNQMLLDLVDTIAERAGLELPKPAVPDERGVWFRRLFLPEFYKQFGETRRLVFLFDEFDVLDQAAQANLPPSAAANAFFEFLRRLMGEDPRPAFVFVVGRRAEDMNIDFTATFKSSLVREVWTLDADSAEKLVRQAEANGSLQFTADAVQRVLALTNSHPYLTQLLCQRIWERAYLESPETAPTISGVEIEAAVPDALEAGNQALVWLWNGLAPAEKIYASALAEASVDGQVISEDRVIQTITEHATRLRTRDVELAPRDLVKRRVLEASGPREFRFAVEFFRRWVAVNKPLREVKDELDQVDPLAEQLFSFGQGFFKRQQWQLAARYFTDSLQNNPRHFRARLNLGEALLEMKKTDEAVAELERAYDLDQDEARLPLARALIEQAKIRDRAGDDDAALAALDRALKVSPNEAEARNLRATIFTRRGDAALTQKLYDQAVAAYTEAGLPEKVSQAEAWRKREMLGDLEKKATEQAQQKNWAAAAEGYESLVQQAEDSESLVTWEKKLAEVRAEQEIAELFAEGVTALAERNYVRAQVALQKVVAQRPDYRSNGQTAERLLQRAIAEEKQDYSWSTLVKSLKLLTVQFWQLIEKRVPLRIRAGVFAMVLVVGIGFWVIVGWVAYSAFTPPSTSTPTSTTEATNAEVSTTPLETAVTPAPGTTVAPTVPSDTPTPTLTPTPSLPSPQVLEPSNAANIRPLARLGKGTISQAAYSPDGKLLAVAGSLGIYLYDAQTLEELSITETSFRDSLAWAPDGQTLVSASSNEPVIQRWQIVKNALALQSSLLGHTEGVRALAFADDGRLAAAGFSRDISIWNADDDQRARVFPIDGEAESLAFAADGQWLAVGRKDGVVRVFNANAQGIESQRFTEHTGEVRALAFSPDGRWLASGGHSDNLVIVRDVTTREEVARWEAFNGNSVRTLAFAPDGTHLAVGSFVAVEVFDVSNLQAPAVWKQLVVDASSVAFSPDGQTLATTAEDGVLRQWRVSDGIELETRADFTPEIKSLAYAPQGGQIASGHEDGSVRVWDVGGTAPRLTLNQNLVTPALHAIAFSPDGTWFVTGDYQKVKVWQVADGALLYELTGFNSTVYAIAFSPDGKFVAAGSEDGTLQVWDMAQLEDAPVLQQTGETVHALAFSPDGGFLAAGFKGRVHVWQTGVWDQLLFDVSAQGSDALLAVAFSADGQTLLAAHAERDAIERWRMPDGANLEPVSLRDYSGALLSAAFSPDSQLLVGSNSEGAVLAWSATTGELFNPLNGHVGVVYSVAISTDGRWLASGGNDGTLRLWGVPAVGP